jgi:hypothetical protein
MRPAFEDVGQTLIEEPAAHATSWYSIFFFVSLVVSPSSFLLVFYPVPSSWFLYFGLRFCSWLVPNKTRSTSSVADFTPLKFGKFVAVLPSLDTSDPSFLGECVVRYHFYVMMSG